MSVRTRLRHGIDRIPRRFRLGPNPNPRQPYGGIWTPDPDREIGMRGVVRRKTLPPLGPAYRQWRRKHNRAASRSAATNRR